MLAMRISSFSALPELQPVISSVSGNKALLQTFSYLIAYLSLDWSPRGWESHAISLPCPEHLMCLAYRSTHFVFIQWACMQLGEERRVQWKKSLSRSLLYRNAFKSYENVNRCTAHAFSKGFSAFCCLFSLYKPFFCWAFMRHKKNFKTACRLPMKSEERLFSCGYNKTEPDC